MKVNYRDFPTCKNEKGLNSLGTDPAFASGAQRTCMRTRKKTNAKDLMIRCLKPFFAKMLFMRISYHHHGLINILIVTLIVTLKHTSYFSLYQQS